MKDYNYEQYVFVLKEDEDGKVAKDLLALAKNKKSQLITLALKEFEERYHINGDREQLIFTIKNYDRIKSLVNGAPIISSPVNTLETKTVSPSAKNFKPNVSEEIEEDDSFEACIDSELFKEAQLSLSKFAI